MGGLHDANARDAPGRVRRMSGIPGAENGHLPFVLGIVGDSGSGKSTVAQGVASLIGPDRVSTLELDDYHRHTRAERAELGVTALHPSVHNFPLMAEHLRLLGRAAPCATGGTTTPTAPSAQSAPWTPTRWCWCAG